MAWHYLDSSDQLQGPFEEEMMVAWRGIKLLPDGTLVRHVDWPGELFLDIAALDPLNSAANSAGAAEGAAAAEGAGDGSSDCEDSEEVADEEEVLAAHRAMDEAVAAAAAATATAAAAASAAASDADGSNGEDSGVAAGTTAAATALTAAADSECFYLDAAGAEHGPFDWASIEAWVARGQMAATTKARRGGEAWHTPLCERADVALPAAATTEAAEWLYVDASGVEQGPFAATLLRSWFAAGQLPPSLLVRHAAAADYSAIGTHPTFVPPASSAPPAATAFDRLHGGQHARVPRPAAAAVPDGGYESYAVQASFSSKTGRMTGGLETAGVSHWAKKGLADDRALRQIGMHMDASALEESPQVRAKREAQEARAREKFAKANKGVRRDSKKTVTVGAKNSQGDPY